MNSSDLQVNLVSPFQELTNMILLNNEYSDNEFKFDQVTNEDLKPVIYSIYSGSSSCSPNQSQGNFSDDSQLSSPTFSSCSSTFPSTESEPLFNRLRNPLRSEQLPSNFSISHKKLPNRNLICTFCKNNGEPEHVYRSHIFRDYKNKLCCPILRLYKCPICGESGSKAHTITYCQQYKYSKLNSMIKKITS